MSSASEIEDLRKKVDNLEKEIEFLRNLRSDPRKFIRERLTDYIGELGYEYVEIGYAVGLDKEGMPEIIEIDNKQTGVVHFGQITMNTKTGKVYENPNISIEHTMNNEFGIPLRKMAVDHFVGTRECLEKKVAGGYIPESSLDLEKGVLPKDEKDPRFVKDQKEILEYTEILVKNVPQLFDRFSIPIYSNPERTRMLAFFSFTMKTKDEVKIFNPVIGQYVIQRTDLEMNQDLQKYYENKFQQDELIKAFEALKKEISLVQANLELKKAYSDLESTKDQLVQSEKNASLGVVVAGIFHHFKNALTPILGKSDKIESYIDGLINDYLNITGLSFSSEDQEQLKNIIYSIKDKATKNQLTTLEQKQLKRRLEKHFESNYSGINIDEYVESFGNIGLNEQESDNIFILTKKYNIPIKDFFQHLSQILAAGFFINENSKKAQKIITDVGEYSKRSASTEGKTKIKETLDNILSLSIESNSKYNIAINKDYAAIDDTVNLPASEFDQVFMSLIMNSAEAMNGNGDLKIRIYEESRNNKNYKVISIRDTGIGIDQEYLNKIFDPFFTTKGSQHSGLGLSRAYGIIKNANGFMEVNSEKNKGTEFRIYLPK